MKKLIKASLIVLCTICTLSAFGQKKEKLIQIIKECVDNKDYPGVEKTLKKLIEIEDNTNALILHYINLGGIQAVQKKNDQAEKSYATAINLNPNFYVSYNYRAEFYRTTGNLDNALKDYAKLFELNPASTARLNRALIYKDKEMLDEATADLEILLQQNPKNYGAKSNLATVKKMRGLYEEAIIDYTELINEYPQEALMYNNRADTYMQLKEYDKAIIDINKAISLNPEYRIAYVTKGEIYLAMGQKSYAKAAFWEAVDLGFSKDRLADFLKQCE